MTTTSHTVPTPLIPPAILRTVALAACAPYLTLKVVWLAGGHLGIPVHSPLRQDGNSLMALNGLTVVMDAAVIVLALLLTRPWGRRMPAWLLAVPMWCATGLLTPIVVIFPAQTVASALAGRTGAGPDGGPDALLEPWVWTVVYTGFIVQVLALGTLFVRYARQRWGHLWRGARGRRPFLRRTRGGARGAHAGRVDRGGLGGRPVRLIACRVARRWIHLVLGGALLMPFFLLASVALPLLMDGADPLGHLSLQFAAFGCALPLAALAALLFPLLRPLEVAAIRALCAVPAERLTDGPAASWAARRRSALWFTAHLLAGGIVSGMTLFAPPAAVVLLTTPLGVAIPGLAWPREFGGWAGPPAGLALLALVLGTAWGAGALLARCAQALLGPTPADRQAAADRLAAAERWAAELAARNRLARELHDAVGHALSVVTLQAGAARRVLDTDPEFARQALTAIEDTTREAVDELDTVLGLLREYDEAGAAGAAGATGAAGPAPTLDGLEVLFRRARAAELSGDRAGVPPVVSREACRIVQEGLSNALRHAGPVPGDRSTARG